VSPAPGGKIYCIRLDSSTLSCSFFDHHYCRNLFSYDLKYFLPLRFLTLILPVFACEKVALQRTIMRIDIYLRQVCNCYHGDGRTVCLHFHSFVIQCAPFTLKSLALSGALMSRTSSGIYLLFLKSAASLHISFERRWQEMVQPSAQSR
jgi:hypothetical protein